MKIRIKSNKVTFVTTLLLSVISLLVCLSGCTSEHSQFSDLDAQGARIPKVALAPMQIQVGKERYFPNKQVIQEASDYLLVKKFNASNFLISSPQFLQKHNRIPLYSLWHGCNLQAAKMLLPHDFIILPEVKCFELKGHEQEDSLKSSLRGFTHIKPFYYDVQIYIRIIDMTGPDPVLAMQEHLKWEIPISMGQAQSDDSIENWQNSRFDRTGVACALLQVCNDIASRCESRIDVAWAKRLPFSRLAKSSS